MAAGALHKIVAHLQLEPGVDAREAVGHHHDNRMTRNRTPEDSSGFARRGFASL
jgi:hypothetical protein